MPWNFWHVISLYEGEVDNINFWNMNSAVKFIFGFLIGGAMGVSAGLLMAPTTGKQARKKLDKKSKKLAKKLAGMVGKDKKFQGASARKRNVSTPAQA